MTKSIKKKSRRMKKTVRKTLGTLFLVSAIIVAAIPAEGLQAGSSMNGDAVVTVDYQTCNIPQVSKDEVIYTTGDGQYQFAYVSPKNASSANKVAVILGYNGGYLENGALTIPDKIDAYRKYSDNLGTSSGYAAVGKNGNFLFYAVEEPQYDNLGQPIMDKIYLVDQNGNKLYDEETNEPLYEEKQRTKTAYYPCYYEDYSKWGNLAVDQFYYDSGSVSNGDILYLPTTLSQYQRITGVEVWYIGNQYLEAGTGENAGTWKVKDVIKDSSQGIFSGQGNIVSLTVGENLNGIGNYAFYGCSGMKSIRLGNGLDTIGNYAFANCINMNTVNVELNSRIATIGDHAFYNCQSLENFTVPISVTSIGDSAFEQCTDIKEIALCGEGYKVSLNTLGPDAFKNCTSLESITFPSTFTNVVNGKVEPIDINMFRGCTSLKYISTSNNVISFVADEANNGGYSFEDFKEDVPEEFYFEGIPNSLVHEMATKYNFAFSHLGKDLYEITVVDEDDPSIKAVYRVNSSNQLVYTSIDPKMSEVELPKTIGPYKITEIHSGTFQNNYNLKKIVIPSSILSIDDSAFKGCYKLEDVIFREPVNVSYIGADAFKTQDVSVREPSGDLPILKDEPVLNFVGDISYNSATFQYAMNPDSNINVGSQQRTYIKYHSGWPTNLVVQYNPDTDKNELIDYPTFNDIKSGTEYTTVNYAYMTKEYEDAAKQAVDNYLNDRVMTDYEWDIINAALNIVLPEGIESIQSGLFVDKEGAEGSLEKTITAYSLNEVAGAVYDESGAKVSGGAFEGCKNLKAVYLMGKTTTIGDYAFENCENLTDVYIPTTVTTMGKIPFIGCNKLNYVEFQGSPYFTCEKSIIYKLDDNKNKQQIVEFLNGRETGVVDASELVGVTEIADEAFRKTKVSSVDFRSSSVEDVSEKAFAETGSLFSVYLPSTCKSISADAFKDSNIQYMEVPGSVSYIDSDAFSGSTSKSGLTFYCEDGSNAKLYADKNGIKTTSKPIELSYTVTFWDYDATLLDTQTVEAGKDAVPPEVPGRDGYIHTGWVPDYHGVKGDLQITAQYEAEDPDAKKYTVTFLDHDDTVLKTTLVLPGGDAEPPFDPKREGYTFVGWRPAVTNIQGNTTIYAQYEKLDSSESELTVRFIDYDDTVLYTQKVAYGADAITPQNPSREGYTFTGWRPAITGVTKDMDTYAQYEKISGLPGDGSGNDGSGSGNGSNGSGNGSGSGSGNGSADGSGGNGSGNGSGQTTTKLYTLTVRNGSGSGSYAAGSQPIIIANDPVSGQEFDYWSIDPADTKIASKVLTASVVTMPEADVTVTAHYKVKSGLGVSTGSGNSSGNNSNRPNGSQNIVSSGTTVVIDKNGLSNTGVVSVTVNGSSDNFTIKISENSSATEAVVRALMAEYGDDINSVKYFPMDITLYDSTGTKKITDTTGLSVQITLPLPDSLIAYAGNNKVAGVVNDKLDKLTPRFTTISGVPCVTFTAEHFSPYVIYVDTGNLTAGVADNTPKTGDGIHPKWFLSMGLASISAVLFLKKDRRATRRVKVRA